MSAHISIPAEIIQQILSNLDTIDVLKCRLVSKSWNEHSLLALKKKSKSKAHHVKLDSTNIQSFVDFVTSPSSARTRRGLLPSFPWKFELDVWHRDADGSTETAAVTKPKDDFEIFKSLVNSVLNLVGPECVDKVTYVISFWSDDGGTLIHNGIKIVQLAELIVQVSAGLTEILITNLHDLEFRCVLPTSISSRIKLATLERIEWEAIQEEHLQSESNLIDIFCSENMENFEEIKVTEDKHCWDPRHGQSFSKLRILDIGMVHSAAALLENMRRLSPTLPILQEFTLGFDTRNEAEVQVLTDVLASVATTLKSLTLNIDFDWGPSGESNELCFIPLPPLPHLKNFRIDLRNSCGCRYAELVYGIDRVKYHFNPETLPALETVDLPIRTEFEEGSEEFPSVTRLTARTFLEDVRYDDSDSESEEKSESMTETRRREVEKLQTIFPNVSSLTVVKETLGTEDNQVLKDLLLGIMESSQGTSLQELVIRNGDDGFKATNFLGEILAELNSPMSLTCRNMDKENVTKKFEEYMQKFFKDWTGWSGRGGTEVSEVNEPGRSVSGDKRVAFTIQQRSPSVYLGIQNVRTIRLEQFSSTENNFRALSTKRSGQSYSPQGPLSLFEQSKQLLKNRREIELMVQHFPSLTQLQLSPVFFGQTKRSSCLEEIQELAKIFLNLTIYLI